MDLLAYVDEFACRIAVLFVAFCLFCTMQCITYASHSFLERLGIRFQINGDRIPRGKSMRPDFFASLVHEVFTPAFNLRGIQPFHDFPGVVFYNLMLRAALMFVCRGS